MHSERSEVQTIKTRYSPSTINDKIKSTTWDVLGQRQPRGLLVFSLRNSAYLIYAENLTSELNMCVVLSSYPRLTLDFHTNKRIIDEVVRILVQ